MQEKTLYQEIVKQCMIQKRYDALLKSDKEKGIERTEEKLLEELEKIEEKCHAVTSARKVQTLIEDYPHHKKRYGCRRTRNISSALFV